MARLPELDLFWHWLCWSLRLSESDPEESCFYLCPEVTFGWLEARAEADRVTPEQADKLTAYVRSDYANCTLLLAPRHHRRYRRASRPAENL